MVALSIVTTDTNEIGRILQKIERERKEKELEERRLAESEAEYQFRHYQELVDCGQKVNLYRVMKLLDIDYVWDHLEYALYIGVGPSFIARLLGKSYYRWFQNRAWNTMPGRLLEKGADAFVVLNAFEDWIRPSLGQEMWRILADLESRGVKRRTIKKRLCKILEEMPSCERDIFVFENTKKFQHYTVPIERYINEHIDNYGTQYLTEMGKLPEVVSPEMLVRRLPMEQILSAMRNYHEFDEFVEKFEQAGGDVNLLAHKFVDEIGYPCEREKWMAMLSLIKRGATSLSVPCFAKVVDPSVLDDQERYDARVTLMGRCMSGDTVRKFL